MIYVDEIQYHRTCKFKDKHWCHMTADTIEELHDMASKIGLKLKYFRHGVTFYYVIPISKRDMALNLGAKYVPLNEQIKARLEIREYLEQAGILLLCTDNKEMLLHWLFNQDFFTKEGYDEQGNSLICTDEDIVKYLQMCGGTKQQISKIMKVVRQED